MSSHSIHVKTDSFDGPLSLLLLLIQREQMSIHNLDINKITGQYLDYIERMQELNFDTAGDYLYMAAILLFLKSRSFVAEEDVRGLIGDDVESDFHISSQVELIKRLQELKRYQELGQKIWELPKLGHEVYRRSKANRKAIAENTVCHTDVQELINVWMGLLRKEKRVHKVIEKDPFSIRDKLIFLKTLLKFGEKTNFFDILKRDNVPKDRERASTIVTFISLLELARLKKISLFQNKIYGNIFVDIREPLENLEINFAETIESEWAGKAAPIPETTLQH
ncbi:MAG: ScpA family protein [Bacteriovoracales bacterium]|nr:ScpA family protein [Bacteriovoracales bacterium]